MLTVPHLVILVHVADFERLCGTDHGLHRREDVLVDQLDEATLVFVCVPGAMDDAHLFDERALTALSCTYIKRRTKVQRLIQTHHTDQLIKEAGNFQSAYRNIFTNILGLMERI